MADEMSVMMLNTVELLIPENCISTYGMPSSTPEPITVRVRPPVEDTDQLVDMVPGDPATAPLHVGLRVQLDDPASISGP